MFFNRESGRQLWLTLLREKSKLFSRNRETQKLVHEIRANILANCTKNREHRNIIFRKSGKRAQFSGRPSKTRGKPQPSSLELSSTVFFYRFKLDCEDFEQISLFLQLVCRATAHYPVSNKCLNVPFNMKTILFRSRNIAFFKAQNMEFRAAFCIRGMPSVTRSSKGPSIAWLHGAMQRYFELFLSRKKLLSKWTAPQRNSFLK